MARTPRINTPSLLEPVEVQTAIVASVALLQPIDKRYSYRVPPELAAAVRPGMRIVVPFGRNNRPADAFCLDVSEQAWDSTLKAVLDTIDERPILGPKLLELGEWIARYYAAPLGRTLDLMAPAAAKRKAGWKNVRYIHLLNADPPKLSAKQSAVIAALSEHGGVLTFDECLAAAECGESVVKTMAKNGLVSIETCREPVPPDDHDVPRDEPQFDLNADQRAALNQLATEVSSKRFSVQVLHGVTGSGKTECYIGAIRQAIAEGRQAIMLVPEIALTTQTVSRLQARFDKVATIHSGMSDVQRARTWAAIESGEIPVVIGTRSAVFAPCPDLGLIIVDEEAESSYKSQAAPRYHTRDVAVKRAHIEGIPVVLGSATPSLETWLNLKRKRHYQLIRLPNRVRGLAMPTMHLVDMGEEHKLREGVHLLSMEMEKRLGEVLQRGEQAVLLLNKRGYASFLHCPKCKTAVTCPHCSVHMVFHSSTEMAHCHYCRAKLNVPRFCQMSGCGGKLVKFGIGVQRVEEEMREKFPQARLRRIDSDNMQHTADYAEVLGAFERREFDVLVGTQMIAKGLDFPFVSFVGVVSADTALALDDFRSEERTFQLVLQVAGRSGRGDLPGHVVVQTFSANTAPIQHAVQGSYEAFADAELENRKRSRLPPFTRLMRIVLADNRMTRLRSEAEALARRIDELLRKRGVKHGLFGPHSAPIERLRDQYRFDIQLVFSHAGAMLDAIDLFKSEGTLKTKVKTQVIDVDPVSLQ